MSEIGTTRVPEEAERGNVPFLNVANQLTIARLLLSIVFFVILALLGHGVFGTAYRTLVLNIAIAVFVLAVITDFLDGYIARRWHLVSTFGRIADPFVDKIVIVGGFIMLIDVSPLIEPWFAVIILIREFLVSGLRSFLESRGISFGATFTGKAKMLLQSIAVPAVLIHEANFSERASTVLKEIRPLPEISLYITLALLTATLISTIGSCVGYVRRAVQRLREE